MTQSGEWFECVRFTSANEPRGYPTVRSFHRPGEFPGRVACWMNPSWELAKLFMRMKGMESQGNIKGSRRQGR